MPLPFFAMFLIGFGLMVVAYLLAPKPKEPKPPSLDDFEEPTADAGRPVPVIFGSVDMTGLNVLWYGDKSMKSRKIKSGGKK